MYRNSQKGSIIIAALIIVALFIFMAAYFLSFILTDFKISKSESYAYQTYYLAEAGINEAIWKLKNETINPGEWGYDFIHNDIWQATMSRNDVFFNGGSYEVQIQNITKANAIIMSTAKFILSDGRVNQRIIKAKVFKAIDDPLQDKPVFTGGPSEDMTFTLANINIYNGDLFCNNNLHVNATNITVNDGRNIEVVNNLNQNTFGYDLLATAIHAEHCNCLPGSNCESLCIPPGISPVGMPSIDFDSNIAGSYKERAEIGGQIFTQNEFEDLLWNNLINNSTTVLNGITYVTGKINIRGGIDLEINGVLIADQSIEIANYDCWTRSGETRCGNNSIIINNSGGTPLPPSGLLTKKNLIIGSYLDQFSIQGLIYTTDKIDIINVSTIDMNIVGGIVGRKFFVNNVLNLNIIYNQEIVLAGFTDTGFSPVVTIEHWEESY